ncbi:hypothetical protein L6164_027784 [Bauhinia variegata]|uniref:Uncharacterized protein n=1 Tax=Bauhinia variegata TaxID=167791 RepID=A0ACB9LVE1_BAUVA|nr:hypothetical protein L6164_027784 [Bauhinia variegata]
MEKMKKHFVLVHGACHGAWCWYKVSTLLKSAGHKVTALDMAASGIHPKQMHEVKSMSEYFEPLIKFIGSLPEEDKVILVGHSMGGICVSAAMERFPHKISVAVFASALMPGPDLSSHTLRQELYQRRSDSHTDSEFIFGNGPVNPPTEILFGPQFSKSKLYQLSPPEDLALAISLLRPTLLNRDVQVVEKETAVTRDNYGSVARVFIVCEQDNAIEQDFQRWMIQENPPNEVKVIAESDHMPMFSKPQELCSILQQIADAYH